MAQPKQNLSSDAAKAETDAALDKAATTKVTVEKQADGKWTVTTQP